LEEPYQYWHQLARHNTSSGGPRERRRRRAAAPLSSQASLKALLKRINSLYKRQTREELKG
jgi:hypothetical protein